MNTENRWCWIFECWSYWNLIVGVPLGILWGTTLGLMFMSRDYRWKREKQAP